MQKTVHLNADPTGVHELKPKHGHLTYLEIKKQYDHLFKASSHEIIKLNNTVMSLNILTE